MENKQIDILDVLLVLAKHKKFIFLTTLFASIAAVIFMLLADQYWTASATILPAQEDKNQLSFGGSSILGLGSSLLGSSGLQASGIELITIMNSRTFTEDIIKHFNLLEYLEIEDTDSLVVREKAFTIFNEKIRTISYSEETGLIKITIETRDKFLSAQIANYVWQKLEKYNLENRMSKGKRKRIFLERRLNEVESLLDSLSNDLLDFQLENNIIELGEQTINMVSHYSTLIAQQKTKHIQMELLEKTLNSSSNPLLDKLRLENEILIDEISNLEFQQDNDNYKYLLPLSSIPMSALKYANIQMNLEIQKRVYSFLYPQFEQARIEEIKDLPTIEVVDKAVPAGLRSKPKRGIFCIIVFFMTLTISSFIIYSIDAFQKSNNRTKFMQLKALLFRKSQEN